MPSGGCGFLVGSTIASSVTWLGANSSHRYASAWCKISSFEGGKPLYIASVYLPNRSLSAEHYVLAIHCLNADIARYRSHGEIILLGDFNTDVGSRSPTEHARLYGDILPAHGSPTPKMQPLQARHLLDVCLEHDLCFLSGSLPHHAPHTFQRAGANATTTTSIIDPVSYTHLTLPTTPYV